MAVKKVTRLLLSSPYNVQYSAVLISLFFSLLKLAVISGKHNTSSYMGNQPIKPNRYTKYISRTL